MKNLKNKNTVVSNTMFSTPMGSVARVMDNGLGSLADTIKEVAPSCKVETEKSMSSLRKAVSKVVKAYGAQ